MDCKIRKAVHDDFVQIASLIQNELGYTDMQADTFENRFSTLLKTPNFKTFVAECGEQVVGFIGLHQCIAFELEGEYLRIITLAVHSEFQGKGIGTALLH